jgi:hypothetical protein
MQGSQFTLLKNPQRIVLSAGHGGGDPGVVFQNYREADETRTLTDLIADNLTNKGLDVYVVPHSLGLTGGISNVNSQFGFGDAWAIEIHRDSAESVNTGSDRAKKTLGVYYGDSQNSKLIGQFIQQTFLREGAHSLSWARPHTVSRHGRLAWIADTNPVSHLFELGFINGSRGNDYFQWLAKLASTAIYESFTGEQYDESPNSIMRPADLLKELTSEYAETDLAGVFNELGIADVPAAHHQHLKEITLAQWILESGWATSKLANEHFNFGGLKWREEMEGFAEKIEYEAHDGRDSYCKFASVGTFITGYWKFLTRSVYEGWTNHTYSPQAFIRFLLYSGYTTGDDYDDKVITLLPSAENLLRDVN